MELFCLIVGGKSAVFSVGTANPESTVASLKDAIHAKNVNELASVDAKNLTLYTTRKGDEWLKSASNGARQLAASMENAEDWLAEDRQLDPTSKLSRVFSGDLAEGVIHVLVELPLDIMAQLAVAHARKELTMLEMRATQHREERMILEMKARQEREERMILEMKAKTKREQRIPLKRKRAWDDLNEALMGDRNKKYKNDLRPFSSVELESLPKKFIPVPAKPTSEFYKLLENPVALAEDVVNALVETMERKERVYANKTDTEATRVQFMAGVIEHVVDGHVKKDNDAFKIIVEERLKGEHVKAQGRADFVLTRNGNYVCVVEAKDWNFKKGAAQSVLGMEVIVDTTEREVVYGLVTNYTQWQFLKRTDDGVEEFMVDVSRDHLAVDLKRVAECVRAVLLA